MRWLPGALPASLVSCRPRSLPPTSPSLRLPPITLPRPPHSVLSAVPKMPIQVQAPAPEDSDSDSDYEHYDFSAQPPVALTTFYSECLRPRPRALGASRPDQGEVGDLQSVPPDEPHSTRLEVPLPPVPNWIDRKWSHTEVFKALCDPGGVCTS